MLAVGVGGPFSRRRGRIAFEGWDPRFRRRLRGAAIDVAPGFSDDMVVLLPNISEKKDKPGS